MLPALADPILTTGQAAQMLGRPPATLRWWRHTGEGPRSFKMGKKAVAYKTSDVLSWLEAQYESSKTSQADS